MKNLFTILALSLGASVYAQTTTDSLSTEIGDFVVVSSEELDETTSTTHESTSTTDGGTVELVTAGASGARIASTTIASDLQMRLAPNPSSGVAELNITGVEGATSITVTDLLGQTVYTNELAISGERTTYLPAQLWSSGTYIIVVSAGGQTVSDRLVID